MCIARFQYTGRMLRDDYHLPFGINKAKICFLMLLIWSGLREDVQSPFCFSSYLSITLHV